MIAEQFKLDSLNPELDRLINRYKLTYPIVKKEDWHGLSRQAFDLPPLIRQITRLGNNPFHKWTTVSLSVIDIMNQPEFIHFNLRWHRPKQLAASINQFDLYLATESPLSIWTSAIDQRFPKQVLVPFNLKIPATHLNPERQTLIDQYRKMQHVVLRNPKQIISQFVSVFK